MRYLDVTGELSALLESLDFRSIDHFLAIRSRSVTFGSRVAELVGL